MSSKKSSSKSNATTTTTITSSSSSSDSSSMSFLSTFVTEEPDISPGYPIPILLESEPVISLNIDSDLQEVSIQPSSLKRPLEPTLDLDNNSNNNPSSSSLNQQPGKRFRRAKEYEQDFHRRLTGIHTPSIKRSQANKDCRQFCMVCRDKKSKYFCIECTVHLCIEASALNNCWYRFHNCKQYLSTTLSNNNSNRECSSTTS